MSMASMGVDALPTMIAHTPRESTDCVLQDSVPFLLREVNGLCSHLGLLCGHMETQFISEMPDNFKIR
jgi:hypothetical protein